MHPLDSQLMARSHVLKAEHEVDVRDNLTTTNKSLYILSLKPWRNQKDLKAIAQIKESTHLTWTRSLNTCYHSVWLQPSLVSFSAE